MSYTMRKWVFGHVCSMKRDQPMHLLDLVNDQGRQMPPMVSEGSDQTAQMNMLIRAFAGPKVRRHHSQWHKPYFLGSN